MSLNIYEAFESNPIVDEAKEFPLGESSGIKLRPLSGTTSRRGFDKLMEPYSVRLNAGGSLTEAENKALNARFYATYIIAGWHGLTDSEGKDIEYSPERAEALLLDPKLERLFSIVIKIAADEDSFRTTRTEDDAGN